MIQKDISTTVPLPCLLVFQVLAHHNVPQLWLANCLARNNADAHFCAVQAVLKAGQELPKGAVLVEYSGACKHSSCFKHIASVTVPVSWDASHTLHCYVAGLAADVAT